MAKGAVAEEEELESAEDETGEEESKSDAPESDSEAAAEAVDGEQSSSDDDGETKPSGKEQPVRDQAWWEKRAKHFEGEYKRERVKRQDYDKKYGAGLSLGDSLRLDKTAQSEAVKEPAKKLDEMEVGEFADHLVQRAKQEARKEWSEEQLNHRVRASEQAAREEIDGSDGNPSYDSMMESHVIPFLQQNPQAFALLRMMPDPARSAYTLGYLLNPGLHEGASKKTAQKAREDLVKNIDKAQKKAVTIKSSKGGKHTAKKTGADYEAMSWEDFEKEIDSVKAGTAE